MSASHSRQESTSSTSHSHSRPPLPSSSQQTDEVLAQQSKNDKKDENERPSSPEVGHDDDDDDDAGEDTTAETPLTMAASVVLTNLPQDASRALEEAGGVGREKVTIHFRPIGSAPHLTQRQFRLNSTAPFATVVRFLRRRLGLQPHESVYCYVNNVFAPSLDEGVGELWRCFRVGEELVVGYARGQAFG